MEGPCRWGEGQAWGLLQRQGLWGRVWPRQELGPGRCQALLVPLQKGAGGGGRIFHSCCHERDLFSPWTGISFFVSQIKL